MNDNYPKRNPTGYLELVDPDKALQYTHSGNAVTAPCAALLGEADQELKHFTTRLDRDFGVAEYDRTKFTKEISEEAVRLAKLEAPKDPVRQRIVAFQLIPKLIEQEEQRKLEAAQRRAVKLSAARPAKPKVIHQVRSEAMPQIKPAPTRPMPLRVKPEPSGSIPKLPSLRNRPVYKKTKPKKRKPQVEVAEPEPQNFDFSEVFGIENLQMIAGPPDVVVEFNYPGRGKQVGYYHWIKSYDRKRLGLFYDSRHEFSNFFVPAQGHEEDIVDVTVSHRVGDERYDFQCYGAALQAEFGIFKMLFFVLLPETVPHAEPQYPEPPGRGGPSAEVSEQMMQIAHLPQGEEEVMDYEQNRRNLGS